MPMSGESLAYRKPGCYFAILTAVVFLPGMRPPLLAQDISAASIRLPSAILPSRDQSPRNSSAGTNGSSRAKLPVVPGTKSFSLWGEYEMGEPPDTKPPTISGVTTSRETTRDFTGTYATITWTTDEPSDSQVEYGTTIAYGKVILLDPARVTSHLQTLSALAWHTIYHYRVKSRDAAGNLATSEDFTLTTYDGPPDCACVVLSSITATGIGVASAIITWKSNKLSDSQVDYGITTAYAYSKSTIINPSLVVTHTQVLTGLAPGTAYHFRVKSRDSDGNLSVSSDFKLTTATGGPAAPQAVITNINLANIGARSATVSWVTDIPADSQVSYGTAPDCPLSTNNNPVLGTAHSQDLYDLKSNAVYYYRVQSQSAAGAITASNTGTFQTGGYTSTRLVIPRLQTKPLQSAGIDTSDITGLAIANLADVEAVLSFAAYDRGGVKISGKGIANPVSQTLAPGAQLATVDFQLFGEGMFDKHPIGWITIDSNIDAVTCFCLLFNASLSMMDGAPVSSTLVTRAVLTEIEDQGFTDIHVINANNTPANVMLALRREDGTIRASAIRQVAPWGAVAESLNAIFAGNHAGSDYVEVFSDVGIVPFQIMGRVPDYMTALNGQSVASAFKELYSPQYVIGGQMRSTVSIVNLDGLGGSLTFFWYRDDGTQIGPARSMPIAPYGKIVVSNQALFSSPDVEMSQGYLRITSSGPRIVGDVIFADSQRSTFATALPLASRLERCMIFSQVASDQTSFTGLALLNPNDSPASTMVSLFTADGVLEASVGITIPARHRISQLLPQIFPSLQGQNRTSGYVRVTSDQGIAAFSVIGTMDLKTLAAVPAQIIR
jgi:hypothetical protein